ncbi:MAG: hypothetical protein M0Z33_07955 [Actinomycetota bacterium]|nr:hypothetical protein [Actinomycetota bacterium]
MIQPKQSGSPVGHGRGLRPAHMLLVGVTTVVAVVIAFAVLSSIVGFVALVVKLVVVVAVVVLVLRIVLGRAGRSAG